MSRAQTADWPAESLEETARSYRVTTFYMNGHNVLRTSGRVVRANSLGRARARAIARERGRLLARGEECLFLFVDVRECRP